MLQEVSHAPGKQLTHLFPFFGFFCKRHSDLERTPHAVNTGTLHIALIGSSILALTAGESRVQLQSP